MHAIGILLAFLGSSCDSLGTLLQKRAQGQATQDALLQGREEGELDYIGTCKNNGHFLLMFTRAANKQRTTAGTWKTGFSLYTLGSILAFVAIGMEGPSVIVVVSAFTLVVNLLLSPRILHERRQWSDWVGALIAGQILDRPFNSPPTKGRRLLHRCWDMPGNYGHRKQPRRR